ncbi:MAG: FAD:protein FMN transferase [Treponemataceae bacterium]|nr:FAD:protein FMN transferase [Treponemataceae bacterium]
MKKHCIPAGRILCLLAAVLLFAGCNRVVQLAEPVSATERAIGTVCSITIYDIDDAVFSTNNLPKDKPALAAKLIHQSFKRLNEIEQVFSASLETAELYKLNLTSGTGTAVPVSDELRSVLNAALETARNSGDAFNPSLGSVINLWDISSGNGHIPESGKLKAALADVDSSNVIVDDAAGTVLLKGSQTKVDLGGIAKGYAADEVARLLRDAGVTSALVDLGGNIFTVGGKKDGSNWRVGIKNPFNPLAVALRVTGKDFTVVTSGVYERYFIEDGVRYHHLLESETGYPVQNGLMSVTILGETSLQSDMLSTAVFVAGLDKGMELLKDYYPGVTAVFITDDYNVLVTGPEADLIECLDFDFTLYKTAN